MTNDYSMITDKNDHRYPMTRIIYQVSIPEAFTSDRSYSYGDLRVDAMRLQNRVVVRLPIARLAELHHQGVRIGVVRRDDVVRIYNATQKYLLYFLNYARTSPLNRMDIPTDDLLKMDAFASSLYEPAALDAHITPEVEMSMASMLNNDNVLEQLMRPKLDKVIDKIDPRESLEEEILFHSSEMASKYDTATEMIPLSQAFNEE